jgi:hypothetical protein
MGNACSAGDTTHPHAQTATVPRRRDAALTTVGPQQVMSSPTLYPSMPATHVASRVPVALPLDASDARSSPPPAQSSQNTGRIDASIDDNAVSGRESSSGAGDSKDHLCRVKGEAFDKPKIQLDERTPHAGGIVAATRPQRAVGLDGLNGSVNDSRPDNSAHDATSALTPAASGDGAVQGDSVQPVTGRRQRPPSVFHSTVSRHASWENHLPIVSDGRKVSDISEALSALPPITAPHPPPLQCVVSPPLVVARRATSAASVRSILANTPTFSASSSCTGDAPFDDDVDASFQGKQPEDSLELPAASSGAVVNASRQPHRPSSVVYHHAVPSSPIAQRNNLDGYPLVIAHSHAGSTDDCSSPLGSIYKFGRRRRSSSRSPSRHAVVHVARPPHDCAPGDDE